MNTDSESGLILRSEFDCLWELPPEQNVSNYIIRKAKEHHEAGRVAAVKNAVTEETINYGDIDQISRSIASKLHKLGLRKGDTVIYSTHDPAKVHVFLTGVWRANGIVRSSYPEDVGDVLVRRILESQALFLACDEHIAEEYINAVKSVPWNVTVIVFGNNVAPSPLGCLSIQEFYEDDGNDAPETNTTLEDIALILPTSGTTGDSKGAVYTHRILLENILAQENMPFTDKDEEPTIITSRQTHYVGAVVALSFLTKGRMLLTMSTVSVERLLETVDKYGVRAIVGFPKYLIGLVNHPDAVQYDTSSIHYLACAGQVVVPEALALIKMLPNLQTFINLYGMTEAGLLVTSADWAAMKNGICKALDDEKDYTVGKLPPKTQLKVLDFETGNVVGADCKGELCFKTPIMTAGYLNRVEEEAETFQDGWVKTGDVGYYDENGFIYIVDRAKEIFKYYNNHISPSEIENVLLGHPSVAEAVVIGVLDPEGGGYIPRGFIVPKTEHVISEVELKSYAEQNLPSYKQLKGGIFILSQIPVGKTGKVTRKLFTELELPIPAPAH
ncbi:unnamed protein product [Orchesella dallaii]|uniref:Uncharacterized protein n=1 Tax=Orchesella dallaii TaxID=48710 RepID=A0ABP1RQB0_9HEXA